MRILHFIGTAVFIVFTIIAFKQYQNTELGGFFAYSAILGMLGEMGRKKVVFPLIGSIAGLFLLVNAYFVQSKTFSFYETTLMLGLILSIFYQVNLSISWLKNQPK